MNSLDTDQGRSKSTLFIGIDVHKKHWVVALHSKGKTIKTFSMNPSATSLISYVNRHHPGSTYYSVYEAGYSGFWIHERLASAGFRNLVVHPSDIPTTHKERTYKDDRRDARKLARALASGTLEGIFVPDQTMQQIRSLWRLRCKLIAEQTRFKNRIKAQLAFLGYALPQTKTSWSGAFLKELSELEFINEAGHCHLHHCLEALSAVRSRLARLTKELRGYVQLRDKEGILQLLMSVPGVGLLHALALYCEVIDINRFSSFDRFCSYVGFVPSTYSSGDREDNGRLTWRCNRYLRTVMVEAAWVAIRKDPVLRSAYLRLKMRMKPQQAITRIGKKLLRRIWSIWRSGSVYIINTA